MMPRRRIDDLKVRPKRLNKKYSPPVVAMISAGAVGVAVSITSAPPSPMSWAAAVHSSANSATRIAFIFATSLSNRLLESKLELKIDQTQSRKKTFSAAVQRRRRTRSFLKKKQFSSEIYTFLISWKNKRSVIVVVVSWFWVGSPQSFDHELFAVQDYKRPDVMQRSSPRLQQA